MSKDRLSDIWNGFSQRSSLDLSGTSVDDTLRPSRRDQSFERSYRLPEQTTDGQATPGHDPVAAALTAMHTEMQATAKAGKGRQRQQMVAPHHSMPPESALERTLLSDISFTKAKVSRRGGDYLSYATERQAEWQRRKRKKFLGIF
ncbi:hypothetical protein [Parvularcula marina]|uniref:hypothetical protein n=1 Tax=Parvularcula marina TaxID=2292771 RepID=UPI00351267F7